MCNLVSDSSIFKENKFDESFPVAEDSELFARLKAKNIEVKQVSDFPVIHHPSVSWQKTISRAFIYGFLQMKIIYSHRRSNVETVNTRNVETKRINPISNRIRIIVENILFLVGLLFGSIFYIPMLIRNKINNNE